MKTIVIGLLLSLSVNGAVLPWTLKSNPQVSYLGQTIIKTGSKFEEKEIGGLSGLSFHNNELWTVTDKNIGGDNHCFIFEVNFSKEFQVTIKRKIALKKTTNKSLPDQESDQESITTLPDGTFLTSMEGDLHGFKKHPPAIYYFDMTGIELQQFILPDLYLGNIKNNRGILDNKGPEAFTYFKDNNQDYFILSSEFPLKQDEQKKSYPIRLGFMTTKLNNKIWNKPITTKEFLYLIDDEKTGLVDMSVYSPQIILTLERTFNPFTMHVSGKIFKVSWDQKSSNIINIPRLEKTDLSKLIPVKKTLLVDLEEIAINAGLTLDNFEGITIIPSGNDKEVVLGIVSDNNYNPMQQTVFAGFKVKKAALK